MQAPIRTLLASVGDIESALGGADLADLPVERLIAVNSAVATLRRRTDALQARLASEISRASRPELGPEGLAKQNGFRTPVALIAAVTGSTNGDAAKLVAVGEATAPRPTFGAADAPPRYRHVADGLEAGAMGVHAAHAIIRLLDRIALRCAPGERDAVEQALVAQAAGLTLDQLAKVLLRAEGFLDPEGLEPREEELRAQRSLVMFQRGGMLHIRGTFDPETGAPIKAAIEAIVTAEFRGASSRNASRDASRGASLSEPVGGFGDAKDSAGAGPAVEETDADRRTVPQRQADALAMLATHALGCARDLPLDGATVVVRVSLEELRSGVGVATIDGVDQPVSIATARRMAASGGVIPCVLGERGEILDWGRQKRLFTKAQKLALVERDGGCVGCGLPPGMTKVHHLRWWARDSGPTDLSNGVLLCESCHHRIHDNGWEIRIEGIGVRAKVWLIPPPHVDSQRTPRLGGRARYDYAA